MSYNMQGELNELKQRICNLVSYIIWLYDEHYITQRTRDELLKRINPNVFMKGGEDNESRRNKITK